MMVEKVSLTRDRDALGAAVGVRTIPAPHATLVSERSACGACHGALPDRFAGGGQLRMA